MRKPAVISHRLPAEIKQTMTDVVTRANSTYYWAMRLQPPHLRESIFALYAFCRVIDDLVDGPTPLEMKQMSLNKWRQRIDHLYDGKPDHPLTTSLSYSVETYDLPKQCFEDFLDGMQMDLDGLMRSPHQSILEHYCWRTAGSMGELTLKIFGIKHKENRDLARDIGKAMTLTNILRDCAEDALHDRLYIPKEDLERAGIAFTRTQDVVNHPNFPLARHHTSLRATQAFNDATIRLKSFPYGPLKSVRIMLDIYKHLLCTMQKSNWQASPKVTAFDKIMIATRHFALSFFHDTKKSIFP